VQKIKYGLRLNQVLILTCTVIATTKYVSGVEINKYFMITAHQGGYTAHCAHCSTFQFSLFLKSITKLNCVSRHAYR